MIENIIIKSSKWKESDIETLFGDEEVFFAESTEMGALMRELGVFPSASQARKAGRKGDIPVGWTPIKKTSYLDLEPNGVTIMLMDILDALEVVMDLARGNIIDSDDPDMRSERLFQQSACDKVEKYVHDHALGGDEEEG